MINAIITGLCVIASINCNAQPLLQYPPEIFRWGDFGETRIYAGGTHSVQLILTDNRHQPEAENYAAQLSQQGNLSSVLNIDNYLVNIQQRHANCFDAATPLSVYTQDIQQHHQFKQFNQAFITGFGSAGAYLFAMLAQTPKGVFIGAYSLDWHDNITLPTPPCNSSNQLWDSQQKMLHLDNTAIPATPWKLFNTNKLIQQWMPDFQLLQNWQADQKEFEASLTSPKESKGNNDISRLPLIEMPIKNDNKLLAIIISGDGGWANIDKDIANQLTKEGIAVVGWNALNYFWEEKSPDIAGKDLQTTINYYTSHWEKDQLLLIGFSMGADVMPFMVNRLDTETQKKIISVNLLNPSNTVDFVFRVSGWLGSSGPAAHVLYPEMKNWNQWPTLCFYSETKDSLCEKIKENNAQKPDRQQLIYLPGDHHFNGDYQKLVTLILENKDKK